MVGQWVVREECGSGGEMKKGRLGLNGGLASAGKGRESELQ